MQYWMAVDMIGSAEDPFVHSAEPNAHLSCLERVLASSQLASPSELQTSCPCQMRWKWREREGREEK